MQKKYIGYPICFIIGFWVTLFHEPQQNNTIILNTSVFKGKVVSLVHHKNNQTQFELQTQSINNNNIQKTFLVSCSHSVCPKILVNESWQFSAKISKPKNFQNPGAFDYVRFLQSKHISGVLYPIANSWSKIIDSQKHYNFFLNFANYLTASILQLRYILDNKIQNWFTEVEFTKKSTNSISVLSKLAAEDERQGEPKRKTAVYKEVHEDLSIVSTTHGASTVEFQKNAIIGIFEALTIGETSYIDNNYWDLFRKTGTTHLIDISGEHIALVAGFAFWLMRKLWSCSYRLCTLIPAPKVAAAFAIIIASIYAQIAGFAVPTQRALLMLLISLVTPYFFYKKLSGWQIWRYTLLIVLLLEPHSVYMIGFYFSFIAVAILIYIYGNHRVYFDNTILDHLHILIKVQFACLLGLMPLSLYWFSYIPINAIFTNIIAIPYIGFLVVPLALMTIFCSFFINIPSFIITWFNTTITIFLKFLIIFSNIAPWSIDIPISTIIKVIFIMFALLIVYIIPNKKLIPLCLIVIITSIYPTYSTPIKNNAIINILDVGQGLCAIIKTKNHTLIYDTASKNPYTGTDLAQKVIIPYLQKEFITKIDAIVVSHEDLDHRGGLDSLLNKYHPKILLVNNPKFYNKGIYCHTKKAWDWDGVKFAFLSTNPDNKKNDSSCVLKISTAKTSILLTGDIEKTAEKQLINKYNKDLHVDFMLVPHHGSKTSSSWQFLKIVQPKIAMLSYALNNRYHLPNIQIINRYKKLGIKVYSTAICGMISINTFNKKTSCYQKT